ncbi:MAG TPA: NAD(P)/FAD-dependent oxidoreductase [Burkholderiales bacterium]|nr:NAD(P)/FAD-dependent oxidoreductase [Burkholderiales bacterium]
MYDCIILGAGHNSLVLQAYLGRAGLKTLSLERAARIGGGLATVEDPRWPGFRHNIHSVFHRAIDQMPWYRELELARRGARYVEPELNVALVLKSGDALCWWTEFEKTAQSFAAFSARDAATLRRWREAFVPILERILGPEARKPPEEPRARNSRLEKTAEGRLLLETSALSPLEFVEREFEHPVVKAGLLFFNGLREVDLRLRGFGHHIPALLASPAKAQLCLGGAARLGDALADAVRESGGEIRTSCEPKRILVERGRVTGVETQQGEVLRARFVVSGLNPQQTFLELMSPSDLPDEVRRKAAAFEYNLLAPLFSVNLVLKNRPRYRAEEKHPELARAFMVILGLEHFEQFHDIVRCHEENRVPPPVMWGACPTLFDASQAPAGAHTAFMWEKVPYRRPWDSEREHHGEELLREWTRHAPNLADDTLGWFARSPLDTERELPNMREGDLLGGSFANGQVGYDRPFRGAGQYRGPVEGLYLCGSCCHPGGNVTGLPGYNSAQVVRADLGV